MRLLVFALTILAVGFFAHNMIGKKGTFWHIVRGILVLLCSLAPAAINTLSTSSTTGLKWDATFQAHFWLGAIFFLSLLYAIFYGYQMTRSVPHSLEYNCRKNLHRVFVYIATASLFFSLAFAAVLMVIRH